MRKAIIALLILAAMSSQAIAQRTTPTEVQNTPDVNVVNSPTVRIDAEANVVTTHAASKMIQLWTPWSQHLPNDNELISEAFDTTGYKEMRVIIFSDHTSAYANLIVKVEMIAYGTPMVVGSANFAVPAHPITEQGNFVQTPGLCMFSVPIYGNSYRIKVQNNTGGTANPIFIFNPSHVYLVN